MNLNSENKSQSDSLSDDPNEILKRILKSDENDDDCRTFNHEEEIEDFGSPVYWDKRYEENSNTFEWIIEWEEVNDKIKHLFKGDELVLDIGCGSSEMGAKLQRDYFKTVVAIDISSIVIRQMIEKHKDNKNLIWLEMDCRALKFKNETFDIVFDKGTLDAIVLGSNQEENVYIAMREIWRVLKVGGYFIIITFESPEMSLDLYKGSGMTWQYFDPIIIDDEEHIKKNIFPHHYYTYVFKKELPEEKNK